VINNAGGMGGGPRNTIDLNTYGVRRVCEAFAPLIQAGGRIVQVSSGSAPMFVEKCSPEMKEFCVKQDVTWKEIEGHLIKPFLNLLETDCPGDRTKALESKGYGTRSINCNQRHIKTRLSRLFASTFAFTAVSGLRATGGSTGLARLLSTAIQLNLAKGSLTSRAPAALQASSRLT